MIQFQLNKLPTIEKKIVFHMKKLKNLGRYNTYNNYAAEKSTVSEHFKTTDHMITFDKASTLKNCKRY